MINRSAAAAVCVLLALTLVMTGCGSLFRQSDPASSKATSSTESTPTTASESTEESSAPPSQAAKVSWSKYDIFPEVRQWSGEFPDGAYRAGYDAIEAAESSVDVSSFLLTAQQADSLVMALFNRINFEFPYIHDITHSLDNETLNFEYTCSAEECKTMAASFESKVEELTATVLNPSYSDFRNVLSVYDWMTTHVQYSDTSAQGLNMYNAYSAIVDEKSICLGFTNAVRYLLTRVGVECLSITAEDGSHMWNMVKIDGEYYHIDATWGLGQGLQYFGMNDEQRRAYDAFPDGWFCGNPNYLKIDAPICNSDRYAALWQVSGYSLEGDGLHYCIPRNDNLMIWGWNNK